jgi:enoyl-CoA hydratase/carnithine racemase
MALVSTNSITIAGQDGAGREGLIHVVRLSATPSRDGHFENRFNPPLIAALNQSLDKIFVDEPDDVGCPLAIIITSAGPSSASDSAPAQMGKFFSNGHDVEFLASASSQAAHAFLSSFYQLLARLMSLPWYVLRIIDMSLTSTHSQPS